MKLRDCERDGYKLWGDQLLLDWIREEKDRDTRDRVLSWVLALVETPDGAEGIPVPGAGVPALCQFVPETEVVVVWVLDRERCIVWIIDIDSLAGLGGWA